LFSKTYFKLPSNFSLSNCKLKKTFPLKIFQQKHILVYLIYFSSPPLNSVSHPPKLAFPFLLIPPLIQLDLEFFQFRFRLKFPFLVFLFLNFFEIFDYFLEFFFFFYRISSTFLYLFINKLNKNIIKIKKKIISFFFLKTIILEYIAI
jgi:hypothetical protein